MQLNTITNQTIALAGIAQTAALVQQLATKGTADPIALETSIASILKIDSDSVIDKHKVNISDCYMKIYLQISERFIKTL